jgi:surface protein
MKEMFFSCKEFNQPLNWDVSKVENMKEMFYDCAKFNQPLNWNVSNVRDMSRMFYDCAKFNQPLNWDVSKVENMKEMFYDCAKFNQPLKWDVSNVRDMSEMFYYCKEFNQPLNWDVSNVRDMSEMFSSCKEFNQPLNWNVSNVTIMKSMFSSCDKFNQPLNNWDVGKVENMKGMFSGCDKFNQPLNNWDVGNVRDMRNMFWGCMNFNQPLNNWDISNVINMSDMFYACHIEQRYKPVKLSKQILRYAQVMKHAIPLFHKKHHLSIHLLKSKKVEDLITFDEISLYRHLNESIDNIVFYHLSGTTGHFYLTDRDTLKRLANDMAFVRYKCHDVYQILHVSLEKFDPSTPYLAGKSFGFYGLIPIAQLKTIIENKHSGYQFIVVEDSGKAPSVVSLHILQPGANAVSASHCQEGHGDTIYKLSRIDWKHLPFSPRVSPSKTKSHKVSKIKNVSNSHRVTQSLSLSKRKNGTNSHRVTQSLSLSKRKNGTRNSK